MFKFAISPSEAKSFEESVRTLRRYLRRHAIKSLLLGLSGGADSVLALHLLAAAAEGIPGFRLGVAHANFHLRGEESMRDERFVRSLQDYYAPRFQFFYRDFATEDYARDNQVSIEMAARQLRHEWWDNLCRHEGFRRIATGHNADDNEETLLLNLLRGASPRGLRGMSTLGDRIFRPLLGLHRKDILRLLAERRQAMTDAGEKENLERHVAEQDDSKEYEDKGFVTDSSNLESEYRRNFLRNEIIPMLEGRWAGVHTALQTSLRLQAESAAIIDFAIEDFLKRHNVVAENEISYDAIRKFPAPASLIFHWLRPFRVTSAIATEIADHVPHSSSQSNGIIRETSENGFGERLGDGFGKRWMLSEGAEIVTTPTGLRLMLPTDQSRRPYLTIDDPLPSADDWEAVKADIDVMKRVKSADSAEIYLPDPPADYEWRRPAEGDRLKLFPDKNGRQGSKLVSDILREAGIPTADRNKLLILCKRSDGEIIWIPGVRRSGSDLISSKNKMIYHLRICITKI